MKKDQTERRRAFLINLLFFSAIVLIIYIAFKYVISWLTPFIIGFLAAALFNPAIKQIEKRIGIGRKGSSTIVLILGYAVLVTLLALILMQVITVLRKLFIQLPKFAEEQILPSLMRLDLQFDSLITLPQEWQEQVRAIQESIITSLINAVGSLSSTGLSLITNISMGIPRFMIGLIFTILASFYFSFDYDKSKKFIMHQLSERAQVLVREAKSTLSNTIFRYLRGYLKIMSITFIELSVGFMILGVDNAIPVAFGIAIFDIMPVLGTGGILIPWAAISLLIGNTFLGIGLLVLYVIITIIRNFIEPKIIGDQLGLNPIVSIMSMYLGFIWMGVGGMILMPMTVQILITLHKKGVIRIYKEEAQSSSDDSSSKLERSEKKDDKLASLGIVVWLSRICNKLRRRKKQKKSEVPEEPDVQKGAEGGEFGGPEAGET